MRHTVPPGLGLGISRQIECWVENWHVRNYGCIMILSFQILQRFSILRAAPTENKLATANDEQGQDVPVYNFR